MPAFRHPSSGSSFTSDLDNVLWIVQTEHMDITIDPRNLGGVAEIAARLGVPTTNVTTWMSRRYQNSCPAPLVEAAMGGIHDLVAWENWHAEFTGKKRTRKATAKTA